MRLCSQKTERFVFVTLQFQTLYPFLLKQKSEQQERTGEEWGDCSAILGLG